MESSLDGNLLDILTNVEQERICWSACLSQQSCNFYNFHDSMDPLFPATCFLLDRLVSPVKPSAHCHTGPANCSQRCLFVTNEGVNTTTSTGLMFTDTNSSVVVQSVALGTCQLQVLAIGMHWRGKKGCTIWSRWRKWLPVLQCYTRDRIPQHQRHSWRRRGAV